jgi:GAF domain-containing protein
LTIKSDKKLVDKKYLENIRQIVAGDRERDAKLLAICRFLNANFADYDWVGFYLSNESGQELVLGPYVGAATEHVRIPFGRGICGKAAVTHDTINVTDVSQESNYLACSLDVRSEIVIPIIKSGKFLGELDIDSHRPARFSLSERQFLEKVVQIVAVIF